MSELAVGPVGNSLREPSDPLRGSPRGGTTKTERHRCDHTWPDVRGFRREFSAADPRDGTRCHPLYFNCTDCTLLSSSTAREEAIAYLLTSAANFSVSLSLSLSLSVCLVGAAAWTFPSITKSAFYSSIPSVSSVSSASCRNVHFRVSAVTHRGFQIALDSQSDEDGIA